MHVIKTLLFDLARNYKKKRQAIHKHIVSIHVLRHSTR